MLHSQLGVGFLPASRDYPPEPQLYICVGVAYHPVIDILKVNFDVLEGDGDAEISDLGWKTRVEGKPADNGTLGFLYLGPILNSIFSTAVRPSLLLSLFLMSSPTNFSS